MRKYSVCLSPFRGKTTQPIQMKLCTQVVQSLRKDIRLFLNEKKRVEIIYYETINEKSWASKLCIGTRLQITQLEYYIVKASIMTHGMAIGENVLISRIPKISTHLPFQFIRGMQFPVKTAYSRVSNPLNRRWQKKT